jgi:hypothetical protein
MTRQPGVACRDHGHTDPLQAYRRITGRPKVGLEPIVPPSSDSDQLLSLEELKDAANVTARIAEQLNEILELA